MSKKITKKTDRDRSGSAPVEETPWHARDRTASEPDPTTQATTLLLSEAAHHAFRLEPLAEASWSRAPRARKHR